MSWQESEYKPQYGEIAAKVLAGGESLAAVCAELNICRKTLYNWRDAHPEFAKALQLGLQKAQRDWESIGREGVTGKLEKFSAPTWIFTMKNRFREDYQDDKKEDKKDDATSLLEKIITGEVKIKQE